LGAIQTTHRLWYSLDECQGSEQRRVLLCVRSRKLLAMKVLLVVSMIACSPITLKGDIAQTANQAETSEFGGDEFDCFGKEGVIQSAETVILCGEIDAEKLSEVRQMLERSAIVQFAISSHGGDSSAAMDIASLLNEENIPVVVFDRCISACAQFILVAADNVVVADNTFVGFHQTATGLLNIMRKSGLRLTQTVSESATTAAEKEMAFFEAHNLSTDLLTAPLEELNVKCIFEAVPGSTLYRYSATWSLWTPSVEYLMESGVDGLSGYWPRTREDFRRLISTTFPDERNTRIFKFQYRTSVTAERDYGSLGWCSDPN
jgi:ATP-dependent protease ClpP protease subunit